MFAAGGQSSCLGVSYVSEYILWFWTGTLIVHLVRLGLVIYKGSSFPGATKGTSYGAFAFQMSTCVVFASASAIGPKKEHHQNPRMQRGENGSYLAIFPRQKLSFLKSI